MILRCPVCNSDKLTVVNNSSNILLRCECGNRITVTNGVVEGNELYYPKNSEFIELKINVTKKQSKVIQAAFVMFKEYMGVKDKYFFGTALMYICLEFIASLDWTMFSYPTRMLINAVMEELNDK